SVTKLSKVLTDYASGYVKAWHANERADQDDAAFFGLKTFGRPGRHRCLNFWFFLTGMTTDTVSLKFFAALLHHIGHEVLLYPGETVQ
ncbi:11736_t:CDS:2, partial [Funneliformis geosporum]